ncbi:helix-turn-helix domain-containing protein [Burkholderia ubonensis]|uniref:helix-turn-helix domain-containing protein n=1 Tax=Burkholderia ubonensis TaxID=101571 RepID=UPI0009B39542|nr:helix-turn-helix transcriptional regulator [Burkholderia ubonensis]
MENSKQGRTPFGERLLRARRKRGLSQKQVEMHVGIAQSNLAELELKGTGSGFTVALALLYGVNPVWLALGKGPMTGTMPAPEWLEPLTSDELEIVRKFVDDLIAARETKADPPTAGDDPALKAPESRGGPKKAK